MSEVCDLSTNTEDVVNLNLRRLLIRRPRSSSTNSEPPLSRSLLRLYHQKIGLNSDDIVSPNAAQRGPMSFNINRQSIVKS